MSFKALAWVSELKTGNAGSKLVLFTLAQFSDEQGRCWPSQKTIADFAECSERTVRGHLFDLESAGFISRTSRTRHNGSFTSDVFHLNLRQAQLLQPAAKSAVGKKQQNPAAKSAAPEPVITTTNVVVEPVIPEWIDAKDWNDFVAFRAEIKKPLTKTAISRAIAKLDELRKQGHDVHQLIDTAILNRWQSFYPPKTAANGRNLNGGSKNEQRASTIAALTGGNNGNASGNTFDGTARAVG